ncbi:MAG: sirohydrochlorin cobaltochelatase [Lachnospiraceae bacterium]
MQKEHNSDIIRGENLFFSYEGEKEPSLKNLNIRIPKGKKIAVMGANGSGKSTFFLCCNGILKPQQGMLYLNEEPYDYTKKGLLKLRSEVGIVFQDPDTQLFSSSVYQEISFGILNKGATREEAKEEVEAVMEQLSVTAYRDRPTHALSGGQKKQVSIADVLVMKPGLMILDEPAAALDPYHVTLLEQVIQQMIEQHITVMIATHDVNYAYEWAEEVILFHEGRVAAQGDPQEIFANKRLLEMTHLKQPSVVQMFEKMQRRGILRLTGNLPKNLAELEAMIRNSEDVKQERRELGENKDLSREVKKAILVVSFGTSHEDTRKLTIDRIEEDIRASFTDHTVYRAWTSGMIRKKIAERDKMYVMSVKEAFDTMKKDGITDVIVQPTHVINGVENDLMKEDALKAASAFRRIQFGDPLLTTNIDNEKVIQAVAEEFSDLEKEEALVLMGHGTTHFANAIYAALDYEFKDRGYPNIFLGTVEAYPSFESILGLLESSGYKKLCLAPFMIVAGDHAKNDLSGQNEDSWYSRFTNKGYQVRCVLRGLGEYDAVRNRFVAHIQQVIETQ